MANRSGLQASVLFASLALSACANPSGTATTSGSAASDQTASPSSTSDTSADSRRSVSPTPVETVSINRGRTSFAHADPQGDVASISGDAESFEEATPAPKEEHGDIVSTRVEHTATQVLIRVRFTDLSSGSDADSPPAFRVSAGVETETGLSRAVEVTSGAGLPSIQMLRLSDVEPVECQLDHRIDNGRDVVTISIPRTCLGKPEWVQVTVSCVAWLADRADTVTVDDALVEGYDAISRNMKSSPPAYHP